MAPTGQWFGRAFHGLPPGSRQIALTFDDGPNDPHTLNLLDVLAKHHVHATFFLIGRHVRLRPELALQISNRGHVIGNHTFTHMTPSASTPICFVLHGEAAGRAFFTRSDNWASIRSCGT